MRPCLSVALDLVCCPGSHRNLGLGVVGLAREVETAVVALELDEGTVVVGLAMEGGNAVVQTEAAHIAVSQPAVRIVVRDHRRRAEAGSAGVVAGVQEGRRVVVGRIGLAVGAHSIAVVGLL